MDEKIKRTLGAAVGILGVFSYFFEFIPADLKAMFAFMGLMLAIGYIFTPKLMVLPNTLVEKMYCKTCNDIEELTKKHAHEIQLLKDNTPGINLIFENCEKVLTIDHNGYSWLNITFEVLNNGNDPLQRFPFEFGSSYGKFEKSLREYAESNEFVIESKDTNSLKWECTEDGKNYKKVIVSFNQKILPGERRKYSIRYHLPGFYRCTAFSVDVGDWTTWKPLHLYKRSYMKVVFLPNYPYSNPRYCVRTPGGDLMSTHCYALDIHDDGSGGNYVEVEETWPWMYHTYEIQWDLPSGIQVTHT